MESSLKKKSTKRKRESQKKEIMAFGGRDRWPEAFLSEAQNEEEGVGREKMEREEMGRREGSDEDALF